MIGIQILWAIAAVMMLLNIMYFQVFLSKMK